MSATVELGFIHAGAPGAVAVTLASNDAPEALGCPPHAAGFPWCRATVDHPARGYLAALGWVQLVRSTDAGDRFAMDPFEALGPVAHPFCFFGFAPTLFDAPSRAHGEDLRWLAHAFLCRLDDGFVVTPLVGFAWGFERAAGLITPAGPAPLPPTAWDEHRALLAAEHPGWTFP